MPMSTGKRSKPLRSAAAALSSRTCGSGFSIPGLPDQNRHCFRNQLSVRQQPAASSCRSQPSNRTCGSGFSIPGLPDQNRHCFRNQLSVRQQPAASSCRSQPSSILCRPISSSLPYRSLRCSELPSPRRMADMSGLRTRQRTMTRTRVNPSSITLNFDSFPLCSGLSGPGDACIFLLWESPVGR